MLWIVFLHGNAKIQTLLIRLLVENGQLGNMLDRLRSIVTRQFEHMFLV